MKLNLPQKLYRAIAVFAAFCLASCEAEPAQMLDQGDIAGPPIWKVTNKAGTVEGWLFGTIHALPTGFAWRSALLETTIDDADLLVVEVSSLTEQDQLADLFAEMAFDPALPPLSTRITPKLRPAYIAMLDRANVNDNRLDEMESWAAALTLAQFAQSADAGNGVDLALLKQFVGREIVELEGAEAQLAIFDTLPEAEQRDLLDAVIADASDYNRDFNELAKAWRAGDIDELSDLAMRGILADPELYEALLANRNRRWATRIERLFASDEQPFIAVGAGHMIGEDGLPALLVAQGYSVTRIQ